MEPWHYGPTMLSPAVGKRALKSNHGKIIRFAKLSDLITFIIHIAKVLYHTTCATLRTVLLLLSVPR